VDFDGIGVVKSSTRRRGGPTVVIDWWATHWTGSTHVPLSEDEQRILLQIEKDFYDSDPEFAREVGETTLYRHSLRNIKWSVLVGILGLAALVASLQVHLLLAFGAFLVIFASAIIFERNLRKMGRAGLQSVTGNIRGGQARETFGGFGRRLSGRFRRDGKDKSD